MAWKERTPEVALLDAAAGNAVRETSRFGRGISPQDGCEKSCIETIPCARCIDNSLYTEGGDKMVRRAQSRGALLSRRAFPQETAAVAEFDADDFGHHLRRLLDGIEDLSRVLDAGKRAGLVVTGDEVIHESQAPPEVWKPAAMDRRAARVERNLNAARAFRRPRFPLWCGWKYSIVP